MAESDNHLLVLPRLTDEQRAIGQRLQHLIGESTADCYQDLCVLLHPERRLPLVAASFAAIGLLVRIEGRLRAILLPDSFIPSGMVDSDGEEIAAIAQTFRVDDRTRGDWQYLVRWLAQAGQGEGAAPERAVLAELLHGFEGILQILLAQFEGHFLRVLRRLDELGRPGSRAPTGEELRALLRKLPDSMLVRRRLLERLPRTGEHLDALYQAGFFLRPPPPGPDARARSFTLDWPEARYLKDAATSQPERVGQILLAMGATNDEFIHKDVAEVARQIPLPAAAAWAQREATWLYARQVPILGSLAEELGRLVVHLAEEDERKAALALLRALLIFPERSGEKAETDRFADAVPRVEEYALDDLLKKAVPAVAAIAADAVLDILCEVMASVLQQRGGEAAEDDWLSGGRRTLDNEHAGQRSYDDLHGWKHDLVTAARDVALGLAQAGRLDDVMRRLDAQQGTIFRRLAMYVLSKIPSAPEALILPRLLDESAFRDGSRIHYEYTLLLRRHFERLSRAAQNKLLGWVQEGPSWLNERELHWQGRPFTRTEIEEAKQTWQYQQYHRWGEALPAAYRDIFERLKTKVVHSEEGHADMTGPFSVTPQPEPKNPYSADILDALAIPELVTLLNQWQPARVEERTLRRDPLRQELQAAVLRRPGKFAKGALEFAEIQDPAFFCEFFHGIEEALRSDAAVAGSLNWSRLLTLCETVITVTTSPTLQPLHSDGWEVRAVIGRLVRNGVSHRSEGSSLIPFAQQARVFEVLKALLDTGPSEVRTGESKAPRDYLMTLLNHPRGIAMDGVMGYALWVKENLKTEALSADPMYHVLALLDQHLDPRNESDLVVHAAYGWHFLDLCWLDKDWAREHAAQIFPTKDAALRPRWDAAWSLYMKRGCFPGGPDDTRFSALRSSYALAVQLLEEQERSERAEEWKALATHLMGLYLNESLDFHPEDGDLISQFFAVASDSLRAHALNEVPRLLQEEDDAGTKSQRAIDLWTLRLRVLQQHPQTCAAEAAAFSSWFMCSVFSLDWVLDNLQQVVSFAKLNRFEPRLMARLAELAPAHPVVCLRLLTSLLDRGLYAAPEPTRVILTDALASEDPATVEAAERLINRLAASGISAFEDLLPTTLERPSDRAVLRASAPVSPEPTPSSPTLTRIHVKSFKSLVDVSLELGAVNVFIGANGSGKTNLLEALGMLGAAIDTLDAARLKERGVRPAPLDLYKSSFQTRQIERPIQIEATAQEVTYQLTLDAPQEHTARNLGVFSERLTVHDKSVLTRSPRGGAIFDAQGERLTSPTIAWGETLVRSLSQYRPDLPAVQAFLDNLRAYRLFTPTTAVLRGLMPDDAQEPLGLSGSNLPTALSEVLDVLHERVGAFDLDDVRELIEWAQEIGVVPIEDAVISRSVSPTGRQVIGFRDRFMHPHRNRLSGYDASEGALYVLFYLVLVSHPAAPALCAIDNFDQCLHPRLACRLTEFLTEHLVKSSRQQWFLTTHSPLVLDGLDLANDQVRLFAVDRDEQGLTRIKRVRVDKSLLTDEDGGYSLSRLWVMGRLGGVPHLL